MISQDNANDTPYNKIDEDEEGDDSDGGVREESDLGRETGGEVKEPLWTGEHRKGLYIALKNKRTRRGGEWETFGMAKFLKMTPH